MTEKDKKKIRAEEAYRKQLRDKDKYRKDVRKTLNGSKESKKGSSPILWFLIVFIGLFLLFVIATIAAINPAKQLEEAEKNAENSKTITTKQGSFEDAKGVTYAYDVIYEAGDERYVASFEPFLAKDDGTLVLAILAAFGTAYGDDALINPAPELEERNGTNLIRFRSDDGYYYVLTVKEDTGEIHSIYFWKE